MTRHPPLCRSLHYLSGAYPAALAAAQGSPADILCFDLEDSVPPGGKAAARDAVETAVRALRPLGRTVLLRINGLATRDAEADIALATSLPIDGVLLPKAESAADVSAVLQLLDAGGATRQSLWCMVETALGVLQAAGITGSSPRLAGLVVGGNDLAESLRVTPGSARLPMFPALAMVVIAARAYGVAVIDAIHPDFTDMLGWLESSRQGAEWGFDGKSVLDAATARIANAAFAPSFEAVEAAQLIVRGADAGEAVGGYGGHLAHARAVIAMAERVAREERGREE